jgi:hypothetical protein
MLQKFKAVFATAIVLTAGSVNCSSAAPPTSTEHTIEATVVRLNPDGTQRVYNYTMTQSQYDALVSERLARQNGTAAPPSNVTPPANGEPIGQQGQAVISSDSTCAGADLWIYNQTSCPSSPQAILCLTGSGSMVSLHNWYFTTLQGCCNYVIHYWDLNVASFWPGTDGGALYDTNLSITQNFNANQSCTTADQIDGMNEVTLN